MDIGKLTSRKLAAAIIGIVAVVSLVLLSGLYADIDSEFMTKALGAVTGIVLVAIGAQTLLDNVGGK